jgi:hypothetical protein
MYTAPDFVITTNSTKVQKADYVIGMERKEMLTKFSLENLKKRLFGKLTFRWETDIKSVLT